MATNIYVANPTNSVVRLSRYDVEIGPQKYVIISNKSPINEILQDEELMRELAAGTVRVQVSPTDGAYVPSPGGIWVDSLTEIPSYLDANELAMLGASLGGGGGLTSIVEGRGTPGTPIGGVMTVQGAASMTPIAVTQGAPVTASLEILFENGVATDDTWVQVFPGIAWMARGFTIVHDGANDEPDLLWTFSVADPGNGVTTHTGRAVAGEAWSRDDFYFVPQTLWIRSAAASNPPDLDVTMTRIQAWRA
jgi:hypothetical protein